MVGERFDWDRFESIMTGILGQLDVGEDLEYFAVVDENGDVKFWAGTRTMEGMVSELAPFMYRHTVNRTILTLPDTHMVLFWVGGYLVALVSKKESNIGFLVTLVENKFAEEIERLEGIKDLVSSKEEKKGGEGVNGDVKREAYVPGREVPPQWSRRSLG